jgi:hypothetical protein
MAATIGLVTYLILGPSYLSGGSAMVATIVLMIVLDSVHPRSRHLTELCIARWKENNLVLFGLAVGITAILVVIERLTLWLLTRYSAHRP